MPAINFNNSIAYRSQLGFTYVIALFMTAALSILALRALEVTATNERRQRELELLWVGEAYRNAIRQYYLGSPGYQKQYPPDLQALLFDSRTTRPSRPLRKLYMDPMRNTNQWGIVHAPDGGIMGIYSLSTVKPIKVENFPIEQFDFINATSYKDWRFVFVPEAPNGITNP